MRFPEVHEIMVNADRVKRKLPSLLVDGDTSNRRHNHEFMRNRYRLWRLLRRRPQRFNTLIVQLCAVLEDIKREIGN